MKLIIGGSCQGKTNWVRESYGIDKINYAGRCGREELADAQAVNGIHLLVKELLSEGSGVWEFFQTLLERNPEIVLIGDEVGLGIVPVGVWEREWREAVGRLYCRLAKQASEVVRVSCGIGTVIKKAQSLTVELIRHGRTKGNAEGRYVGTTEEELTGEGIRDLLPGKGNGSYRDVECVYVSPMLRCIQTAELIYPDTERVVVPELRECGFGEFEYKNYTELNGNPDYQRFIDSGGECAFPGGESKKEFTKRCADAFRKLVTEAAEDGKKAIAVVAHGGTIMAVLDQFSYPNQEYFCWQVKNGCGFSCLAVLNGGRLTLKVTAKTGPDGLEEYR